MPADVPTPTDPAPNDRAPTDPAPPVSTVLSIAGSDSGGGAGVQMDLRVFCRAGLHGTTALTALTAQNLDGVTDVVGIDADPVWSQVRAVLDGFAVRAAKTGMLWSAATVERIAEAWPADIPLVVDPVMVATSGARLLDRGAEAAYRERLAPRAALLTPNLDEAAVLLGVDALGHGDQVGAARALAEALRCPVLLKGGHLDGDPVDVLCENGRLHAWTHARVLGVNTHGSGCMLSAAIAARLALGSVLVDAVAEGLGFAHTALARAVAVATPHGEARLAAVERAEFDVEAVSRARV